MAQTAALCSEPFELHVLTAALGRTSHFGAPVAEGMTFPMLHNLVDVEKAGPLECLNNVWSSGRLPEAWLTAIIVPVLKAKKPATARSSHRPVS